MCLTCTSILQVHTCEHKLTAKGIANLKHDTSPGGRVWRGQRRRQQNAPPEPLDKDDKGPLKEGHKPRALGPALPYRDAKGHLLSFKVASALVQGVSGLG